MSLTFSVFPTPGWYCRQPQTGRKPRRVAPSSCRPSSPRWRSWSRWCCCRGRWRHSPWPRRQSPTRICAWSLGEFRIGHNWGVFLVPWFLQNVGTQMLSSILNETNVLMFYQKSFPLIKQRIVFKIILQQIVNIQQIFSIDGSIVANSNNVRISDFFIL